MTNAEKYEEVFGMPVDPSVCPTLNCIVCPCGEIDKDGNRACYGARTYEFWKSDYKMQDMSGELPYEE